MARDRRNFWRRASLEIMVAAFVLVVSLVLVLYGAEWIAAWRLK